MKKGIRSLLASPIFDREKLREKLKILAVKDLKDISMYLAARIDVGVHSGLEWDVGARK